MSYKGLKKLEPSEIGAMIRTVLLDTPEFEGNPLRIAQAITQQFHVKCNSKDVRAYEALHVELEPVIHGDLY